MLTKCLICGNQIKQPPSRIKSGRGRYCSNECKWKANGKRWIGNNDWIKSSATQFKKGHKNFRVARSKAYWKILYQRWRLQILEKFNYICQVCGKKANIVHHPKSRKEYPELIIDPNNGIAVCRSCHVNIHRKDLY